MTGNGTKSATASINGPVKGILHSLILCTARVGRIDCGLGAAGGHGVIVEASAIIDAMRQENGRGNETVKRIESKTTAR
jgi:hypothetical protein